MIRHEAKKQIGGITYFESLVPDDLELGWPYTSAWTKGPLHKMRKRFKMATIYLEPSPGEVKGGTPNSFRFCPYGLALDRQTRGVCFGIGNGYIKLSLGGDFPYRYLVWRTPQDALDWMKEFDSLEMDEEPDEDKIGVPPVIRLQIPEQLILERGIKS